MDTPTTQPGLSPEQDRGRRLHWALAVPIMTAVYFVAGKLALLIAIPPGYATAIWPPAGLALAGVLLLGYRVWPGVWLGSFLVNYSAADGGSTAELVNSLLVPSGIAIGAALQAFLGGYAIRRFIGFTCRLHTEREIGTFLLLAGPVSCIVSPTIGVVTLCASGVVAAVETPFSWFAWWVGDTVGAALVTPIVLTFAGTPREIWSPRRLTVALPLSIVLVVAVVSYVSMSGQQRHGQELEFDRRAQTVVHAVEHALDAQVEVLYSIERLYASSDQVTREEFTSFVSTYFARHPGIQALEWVPFVRHADRAAFEKEARADGLEGFTFTEQRRQGEMVRAARRNEYFPVYFVEPRHHNETAIGFDLASNPARSDALQRARDLGMPVATEAITLVQEEGKQRGLLVFVPIYTGGSPPENRVDKRNALQGFALGVYRIDDLIVAALDELEGATEGMELRVFDDADHPDRAPIAGPALPKNAVAGGSGLVHLDTIDVAGRHWTVRVDPTAEYLASTRTWSAWGYLAVGLFATGILGMFLLVVTGRTFQIEQVVTDRTKELHRTNEMLLQKNEALDEFTHVASHDLQEPLRKLVSFSALLERDLGDDLSDAVKRDLGFIVDASDRMQTLVRDLLTLSRAGRATLQVKRVPLDACVDRAVELLGSRIAEYNADIIRPPLPEVFGDDTLITQLYLNLIGNALKFNQAPRPQVRLTADWHEGALTLGVKDNGIGIKDDYRESVFAPFRRLHGRGHYPGSGIGLAICRKAVEMHGGQIWVESEAGKGAHFKFTLEATASKRNETWQEPGQDQQSSSSSRMTLATKS